MNHEDILAVFDRPVEPVPLPIVYRVALLVVACVMILLPLSYVALVGLLGYGVWYHATENLGVFHSWGYREAALLYFGPIVGGAVSLLFLLKPLLAERSEGPRPSALQEVDQPLLFAYVTRLCRAVGAAMPREISVDLQVNASAALKGGPRSLLRDDLVLTVGLPIVSGLSLRQFTGVLAHELGHFAQRIGMRATYVIRSVNAWFARVVYERDAWDERLAHWSKGATLAHVVLLGARALVWLSRRILWCLMSVGHLVSSFMLRQMEYDADRYQARIAGSAAVGEVLERLDRLSAAHHVAHAELYQVWQEGWLADDLPALIAAKAGQLTFCDGQPDRRGPAGLARLEPLFDTHPSARQRVASAMRDERPGIVRADLPATVLFSDYPGFCRRATADYYRRALGLDLTDTLIVPTGQLVNDLSARQRALSALHRYFGGQLLDCCQLFPGEAVVPATVDVDEWTARLREARERMFHETERTAEARRRYADARRQMLGAGEAAPDTDQDVLAARQGATVLGLGGARPSGAERVDPTSKCERALAEMEPLLAAARQRMMAAFTLQGAPTVRDRMAGADVRGGVDETRRLLDTLAALEREWPGVEGLRVDTAWLRTMLQSIATGRTEPETVRREIERTSRAVRAKLAILKQNLRTVAYPYLAADRVRSLGDYAVPTVPDAELLEEMFAATADSFERLFRLYYRLIADLALIAEQVEDAMGLGPLFPGVTASAPSGR
jgi:Zn-dependent protease with chaperone function